ncbi:unnamed protein product [Orchesella dallaii]|uniref:Uncharacterized protein n=1 Tax=Orchesella dallaii TaxID=48710 RepID=A0ABP1QCY9_9HEXA
MKYIFVNVVILCGLLISTRGFNNEADVEDVSCNSCEGSKGTDCGAILERNHMECGDDDNVTYIPECCPKQDLDSIFNGDVPADDSLCVCCKSTRATNSGRSSSLCQGNCYKPFYLNEPDISGPMPPCDPVNYLCKCVMENAVVGCRNEGEYGYLPTCCSKSDIDTSTGGRDEDTEYTCNCCPEQGSPPRKRSEYSCPTGCIDPTPSSGQVGPFLTKLFNF